MCVHPVAIGKFGKFIKVVWVLLMILSFGSLTETPSYVVITCLQFVLQWRKFPLQPELAYAIYSYWNFTMCTALLQIFFYYY